MSIIGSLLVDVLSTPRVTRAPHNPGLRIGDLLVVARTWPDGVSLDDWLRRNGIECRWVPEFIGTFDVGRGWYVQVAGRGARVVLTH